MIILLYVNDIAMYIIDSNIQLPISFSLSLHVVPRVSFGMFILHHQLLLSGVKFIYFVGASLYGFNSNFCYYKWYLFYQHEVIYKIN